MIDSKEREELVERLKHEGMMHQGVSKVDL